MPNVSQIKLDLIRKIINAKLSKEESQAVKKMAQSIIDRRPAKDSKEEQTEENEIPLYDETDTNGIINEALNKQ